MSRRAPGPRDSLPRLRACPRVPEATVLPRVVSPERSLLSLENSKVAEPPAPSLSALPRGSLPTPPPTSIWPSAQPSLLVARPPPRPPSTQETSPVCPRAQHKNLPPLQAQPKEPNVPLLCKLISLFLPGRNCNLNRGGGGLAGEASESGS